MESIRARKNQIINVPIVFLPFELGVHKCYVVFSDDNVGELQYTIIGKAGPPEISETFSEKCECEETYVFKHPLSFKNDKLEGAKAAILDKATLAKQRELQATQNNEGKGGKILGPDQKYFEVEISAGIFSAPTNIILNDNSKAG
mmetsp:Transcript_43633/g.42153  ORF Transcript_43633/g.42153 Transcript_43633/m.42153 type:complete len:145 (+) Transcript_43633:466-900(+)